MVLFVAGLIIATVLSGAWCVAEIIPGRIRSWRLADGPVAVSVVLLAAVVAVGTALRFLFVPAHHAMYVDEPWYAEAACNLARLGRLVVCEETWTGKECVPYGKGCGWPVLISPWAFLFGCDTTIGIHLSRVLGAASVLLVALVTRCAGGGWRQSIIAAVLLALHPVHVAWSATAETNVPEAAVLLAGLGGALLYVRAGRLCGAALAVSALGLSTAIRPESVVAAVAAAAILAGFAPVKLSRRLVIAGGIAVVSAAAAATGLQLWSMNEAISRGAFLGLANVPRNLRLIAAGDLLPVHALVAVFAVGGTVALARSRESGAAWLLVSTAVAGALVVLAYERFDERMLLASTVCLLPLCGFILDWRLPIAVGRRTRMLIGASGFGVVVLAPVLLWRGALLSAATPRTTQMLETRIVAAVARLQLPVEALFITEQPPVLGAAGIEHVMATQRALGDTEQLLHIVGTGRPVYFLGDMFCDPGFQGVPTPPVCAQMLERFALSPVVTETLESRSYILYRVSGPATGNTTSRGSPTRFTS